MGTTRESGLCAALRDAYASREDLEMMLGLNLDKSLDDIATSGLSLRFTIYRLVVVAKSEGWLDSLVEAALGDRPENKLLKAWSRKYQLAETGDPGPPTEQQLGSLAAKPRWIGAHLIPEAFEQTPLWRCTLADQQSDQHCAARRELCSAYLQFRAKVKQLAEDIARSMPMFADHSIDHIDALWDTASLICGDEDVFSLNAAESFVLGGAFLLHDLGMGLASYPHGLADITSDPRFDDLRASAMSRLRRAEPSASSEAIEVAGREEAIAELLRQRHAKQAERLITRQFQTSDGEIFYLLENTRLRRDFGSLIGRIAHSHRSDVDKLRKEFSQPQGSCVYHPAEWKVDPLKVACVLRLADAVQIDARRASTYLHAFRPQTGISRDHWYFQERLSLPQADGDRLKYTPTKPFGRNETSAWWLAWDTIQIINIELRQVDALCADLGRPRFAVRSVAGADSPERLALYIPTDQWKPIDASLRATRARELITTLGGEDLYGQKPEVAIRELIANAADATLARSINEASIAKAVTVRLLQQDGAWWLIVEDHGIGMAPETMVNALTDFGYSRWQSSEMVNDFPGLLTSGFQPIGRFGIGFFAVFMVSDEIDVKSVACDEGPSSTHVLSFRNRVAGRPMLRKADPQERLRGCGTTVRARLRHDPRSINGLFKTTSRSLNHTELLHSRLTRMCALAEVDINVQGPDDPLPVRIIEAGDWTRIPAAELFGRLYRREEASHLDRVIYDGYEKLFIDHASDLHDADGNICGRAMLASGLELLYNKGLRPMKPPEALIYVRGLQSDEMYYGMGVFCGKPLRADRLKSWPIASPAEFRSWVEAQAERVRDSSWSTPIDRLQMGYLTRAFGAVAPRLPCAESTSGPLDRAGLAEWLKTRDQILMLAEGTIDWFDRPDRSPYFFTFDGRQIQLPDEGILVHLYPGWLLPEEVCARPRDERFADVVEPSSAWDPRTWWYDTGNHGSTGLVVQTIAEAWNISVVEAVNLMEPLHLQGDRDLRPELKATDGSTVRVTAIRMRRPVA